jgi:hypothetical protein
MQARLSLRRAERAIVRGLRDAGLGYQHQVTYDDWFEIAVGGLIVRVTIEETVGDA